jgi:hypothetical protein
MTHFRRLSACAFFVDAEGTYLNRIGWQYGCLVGSFNAEASEHSEVNQEADSSNLQGDAPRRSRIL